MGEVWHLESQKIKQNGFHTMWSIRVPINSSGVSHVKEPQLHTDDYVGFHAVHTVARSRPHDDQNYLCT